MSYEKINDLIEQAPKVSQWWVSNKRALNRWTFGANLVLAPIFALSVVSAIATIGCYGALSDGSLRPGTGWLLLAAPLIAGGGLTFTHFFWGFTPQRFRYKDLVLKGCVKKQTVSLTCVHNVLSQAVKIDDPQLKPILAQLLALKDTDLPKCWWDALAYEFNKCIVAQHPPINQSTQEKLDAVYVQMEELSVDQPTPKVFHL